MLAMSGVVRFTFNSHITESNAHLPENTKSQPRFIKCAKHFVNNMREPLLALQRTALIARVMETRPVVQPKVEPLILHSRT